MAFLSFGEKKARAKAFDDQLSVAIEILSKPEVEGALGYLAMQFRRDCERAFLPNVRHGVARLPVEQEGSEAIAYLPLLASDGGSSNMRISRALAAPSLFMASVVNARHGGSLAARYRAEFGEDSYQIGSQINNACTITPLLLVGAERAPEIVAGRSVVLMANRTRTPVEKAETIAHELQHVMDGCRKGIDPAVLEDPKAQKREHNLGATGGFGVCDLALERADALGVLR